MGNSWAIEKVKQVAADLRRRLDGVEEQVLGLEEAALALQAATGGYGVPYVDRVAEMPVNDNPTSPVAWWMRGSDEIRGITVQHTLGHDPMGVAR